MRMVCCLPVPMSFADTLSTPFASRSNVTSTFGVPRGAGGMPSRWNWPIRLLSEAIGRSPWNTCTSTDGWPSAAAVGKTLVSSSMIDRVTAGLSRELLEVPVGFKWFVPGLLDGSVAFGGEESAGASFLQRDGSVWTTDKDGIILALLASEITAVTGQSPSQLYDSLTDRYGAPVYARVDTPATREQKAALGKLSPGQVPASELAGEKILAALTKAPGNDAPIGGLKVVTESGWFAARPSGTEDIYKLYAESFRGPDHLAAIQEEARAIIAQAIGGQ